jgi:hypothetical protein
MGRYGARLPDETFEAKIEFSTEKSHLVEMTLGGRYFVPKSQIVYMGEPDIDGNREFTVTGWWWGVKEEAQ